MPEISKAPRRWIIVSLAIIILALVAIISVVLAAQASSKAARADSKAAIQQTKILALEVKAANDAKLQALAKAAAEARKQSECRSSLKSSKQGRTIIEDLRSTYLELAANSTNSENAAVLRRRARNLPMFPPPDCDPGPKKQSP